jgi:hypothetical protein
MLALYAAAMGYAEAAAVMYIRLLYGGVDPTARPPSSPAVSLTGAEVAREAATLVMLASVGWLAGRGWVGRAGAFLLAFGLWDLVYYPSFAVLAGWPTSALDWDVLFLIPLPWWGPVLAPALIAALMALSGAVLLLREASGDAPALDRRAIGIGAVGAVVCLYTFMANAIANVLIGEPAPRGPGPDAFNWLLFGVGYAALARGLLGGALAPSPRPAEDTNAAASDPASPTAGSVPAAAPDGPTSSDAKAPGQPTAGGAVGARPAGRAAGRGRRR